MRLAHIAAQWFENGKDYAIYVDIDSGTVLAINYDDLCPDCSTPLVVFDFSDGDGDRTKVYRYHDELCNYKPTGDYVIQPWELNLLNDFCAAYERAMDEQVAALEEVSR
jgi:hypothetical protein